MLLSVGLGSGKCVMIAFRQDALRKEDVARSQSSARSR
jgi:hypothetical protein